MISDHALVLLAANSYEPYAKPFVSSTDGAVRVFKNIIDGVTIYTFEGTHDPVGWLLDFRASDSHPTLGHWALGPVHRGFYDAVLSVSPQIMGDAGTTGPFALNGHSLGAAMALLLGGVMIADARPPVKISAFAPPRVGGPKFLNVLATAKIPIPAYRFGNDPVTDLPLTIPPDFPYLQVPLIGIGEPKLDSVECHFVANYVAAVPLTLGDA